MMTIFQALILGVLQGLTEFLPISSSGHLVLAQRLMNVELGGADLLFDLTLHIGSLFAVLAAFRKQIFALFKRPFKTLALLAVATIPAAAAGLLLGDIVDEVFFGGAYLVFGFVISAVLLTVAQMRSKRGDGLPPLKFRHAAAMGVAQAVAVIPGISRSGATVTAGIIAGGNREEVANFSFLLSIPVILGGFVVTLAKGLYSGEISSAIVIAGGNIGICAAVGVAASAAAGLFAIKVMLKSISSGKYTPFIIYLCALAIACAALSFCGVI